MRPGMLPKTQALVDRINPLVKGGMLPTQIAREVGINVDTVRHILRRYCQRPYLKVRKHACASDRGDAKAGPGAEERARVARDDHAPVRVAEPADREGDRNRHQQCARQEEPSGEELTERGLPDRDRPG